MIPVGLFQIQLYETRNQCFKQVSQNMMHKDDEAIPHKHHSGTWLASTLRQTWKKGAKMKQSPKTFVCVRLKVELESPLSLDPV